jgi:hypothetical protein
VFRSHDGGAHWSAASGGLGETDVNSLAIDPATPSHVYIAARYGLYKSIDGGDSWTTAFSSCGKYHGCTEVHGLAINAVMPGTLYIGCDDFEHGYISVCKITDGGVWWGPSRLGTGISLVRAVAIDPDSSGTVFGGGGGGVAKSTDGGVHWSDAGAGLVGSVYVFAFDRRTPETLYAGTSNGVYTTTDGGAQWSAANAGLPVGDRVDALAVAPTGPRTLYAGTASHGVYRSTDGGEHWQAYNLGLTNTSVSALALDGQSPATLYAGTGAGVFAITLVPPPHSMYLPVIARP